MQPIIEITLVNEEDKRNSGFQKLLAKSAIIRFGYLNHKEFTITSKRKTNSVKRRSLRLLALGLNQTFTGI